MPPKRGRPLRQTTGDNNDQGGQGDPAIAQILDLLRQQSANIAQQQQQLQQQMQQQQQQQRHQPCAPGMVTFKSFQAVKPPEFLGSSDPVEAQTWLKEVEKAFVLTKIGDEQKTEYASYFLKNEASYWWESTKALEEQGMVLWDRFTELFLDKYCPRYMQNQMELKFFELKQGNMTVSEYEMKFSELSRFVAEYVNTDVKRAKRFQQGLKSWIRSRVAVFELTTYASVVQKAMIIEGESELSQKENEGKKRKMDTQGGGQNSGNSLNRSNRKPWYRSGRSNSFEKSEVGNLDQGNYPLNTSQQGSQRSLLSYCGKCGGKHSGTCKASVRCYKCNLEGHYAYECGNPRATVTCHKCGRDGHYARNCKIPGVTNNMMRTTNQPRARVFNMTTKVDDQNTDVDVVAGTLLVNFVHSRATKSFIYKNPPNRKEFQIPKWSEL